MAPKIGFIGFGEAAFHIGSGLVSEGITQLQAFDIMADDPVIGGKIKERMSAARVSKAPSLNKLIENSDIIFCATSAKYALSIAEEAANYLKEKQVYTDLNSASPKVKRDIAAVIQHSGAMFADAAVMEAVPPHRHKVPIFVSGTGASVLQEAMSPYGMKITVFDGPAGTSSAMKMTRSVFMKGFTTLLLETLLAAYKNGIDKEIMASITKTLTDRSIDELANLLLTRTAIHAERRVAEMSEVVSTLQELEVDASMSQATREKLQSLVNMELKAYFNQEPPAHYQDVLKAIAHISNKNQTY